MLVTGAFEKAKRYIEVQSEHKIKREGILEQGICITISRQAGAGANTVSDLIVRSLQEIRLSSTPEWTAFDKNLIERVIEDHHLPSALTKAAQEYNYTAFTSIAAGLVAGLPDPYTIIHKTFSTITELAQVGNVVIVGRGAHILTSKFTNTFHVRLTAPFDERVKHVSAHYGISYKAALDAVKKDDAERKNFIRKFFHKDVEDPDSYHLIINTFRTGFEGAAGIICGAVKRKFPSKFIELEIV